MYGKIEEKNQIKYNKKKLQLILNYQHMYVSLSFYLSFYVSKLQYELSEQSVRNFLFYFLHL